MKKKSSESISLIIPVYNEINLVEKALKHCIKVLHRDFADYELILVDDGSFDGSSEVLNKLAKDNKHICLLHNLVNLNLGASIQRGMMKASKEYVVYNGVDFPLAIEDISSLLQLMNDCDLLVLERKTFSGYTWWRWMTSQINRFFLSIMFGRGGIRDFNYTQIFRRTTFPQIMPLAKSPAFTAPEMILRARHHGLRVKSVMVDYHPRSAGKGSLGKPYDIIWSIVDMLRYRFTSKKKR